MVQTGCGSQREDTNKVPIAEERRGENISQKQRKNRNERGCAREGKRTHVTRGCGLSAIDCKWLQAA